MSCSSFLIVFSLLLVGLQPTLSFPSLPREDDSGPKELIGDLLDGITTSVGQDIADILIGDGHAESSVQGDPTALCAASDPCCVWYDVSSALTNLFTGPEGRCNDNARAAVRLGFHDAGTWSKTKKANGQDFGGADGSIMLGFGEESRAENNGLQEIIAELQLLRSNFSVGAADLIQFAAAHATVTCPLGPRMRSFIGRHDATTAAPDGLLPSMHDSADNLIALFEDKTISPHDLAALLGAHSVSKQFHQDAGQAGMPQDTTPDVWDVNYYNETLQSEPPSELFVFPSDVALANDPRTGDEFRSFVGDQSHWNEDYAIAFVRLSLLGVNNINNLTECTGALPPAQNSLSRRRW